MKLIVFKMNGNLGVVTPKCNLPIDVIAKRSVPEGVNYGIVESDIIPSDRAERDRLDLGDEHFTDGVGECKYDRDADF